jgi:hypothetical protein
MITPYLNNTLALIESSNGDCALVRFGRGVVELHAQRIAGMGHATPVTRTTAETLAWWLHPVAERRRVWPGGCPTPHDLRRWPTAHYDSTDPAERDAFAHLRCGGAWWRIAITRTTGSTMVYTERDGSLEQHPTTWRIEAVRLGYTWAAATAPAREYLATCYSEAEAIDAAEHYGAHLAWHLGDEGAPQPPTENTP